MKSFNKGDTTESNRQICINRRWKEDGVTNEWVLERWIVPFDEGSKEIYSSVYEIKRR